MAFLRKKSKFMRDFEKANKRKKTIKTLRIIFTIVVTAAVLTVFVGVWRHKKNSKGPNELTDNDTSQFSEEVKTVTDIDSSISTAEMLLTEEESTDASKTEGDTASTLGETDPLKFSKEQIMLFLLILKITELLLAQRRKHFLIT